MKFRTNPLLTVFGSALAVAFAASSASAVTQYWTGAGTWNTGTNWSNTSGGTYDVAWNNSVADIAVFEGTGGEVTIGASRNADGLTFNVTGYTLNAASAVTVTGSQATTHTLAAGVTATLGANVTLQSSVTTQTWNLNGASKTTSILEVNGKIQNATNSNGNILDMTANVNVGGQLIVGGSMVVGTSTPNSGAILNINGGTVSLSANSSNTSGNLNLNLTNGITADSTLTISSGNLTFNARNTSGGLRFSSASASDSLTQLTSTMNFDGGIATIGKIYMGGVFSGDAVHNAIVNLNGGTLKALRNEATFLEGLTQAATNSLTSGAFVKSGGAIFDTSNFNITVGQALIAGSVSGGLRKDGAGILTLTSVSTYTGDTLINNGTLALTSTGGLKFVIGANDVNNKITGIGTVNLDGLFTFDLAGASTTINDSWNIVNGGTLTESFTSNFSISGFTPDVGGILWNGSANGADYQFSETSGVLTVIPEPGAALLGGLGLIALLRRRR